MLAEKAFLKHIPMFFLNNGGKCTGKMHWIISHRWERGFLF